MLFMHQDLNKALAIKKKKKGGSSLITG